MTNQNLPTKSPGVISDKVTSSGVGPGAMLLSKRTNGDTPVNRTSQLSVDNAFGSGAVKTKSSLA